MRQQVTVGANQARQCGWHLDRRAALCERYDTLMSDRPKKKQGLRDLYRHLPKRRRWQSVVVLGLMLIGALAEVLTLGAILPFLALLASPNAIRTIPALGELVSKLGMQPGPNFLSVLAGLFCLVAIGAAIARIFLAWAIQRFAFRIGHDLRVQVYKILLDQPYSFHIAHNSSTGASMLGRVQQVVDGVLLPLMQGFSSALIASAIFVGLLFINSEVAVASGVGFGLVYLLVSAVTRERLMRNSRLISEAQNLGIQTVQEGLGGIRDVLIDNAQEVYVAKFARIDTKTRDAQAANALIAASPRLVIEGLGMVMIVLLALALSTGRGGLVAALPTLGALALGAQRMMPLLQTVYNGWAQFMGSYGSLETVIELLERPTLRQIPDRDHVQPVPFERELSLDELWFRYGEDGPFVLRDLSMAIPKGSRIGLIGKTGSGKSTAMDLVMALLTPTRGAVRVDGQLLTPQNISAWQAQIAHVPQHIYLSDATVLENIAFGVPPEAIDEGRARRAAEQADVAEFVEALPSGYYSFVGERGVRLSGGQRQRIGIARALYKHSALLVLDEATSALDDTTELSIIRSFNRLGRDITVLMIAHRLTTLRGCDRIYRLDNGILAEQGSYDEVIGPPAALPRNYPSRS